MLLTQRKVDLIKMIFLAFSASSNVVVDAKDVSVVDFKSFSYSNLLHHLLLSLSHLLFIFNGNDANGLQVYTYAYERLMNAFMITRY